MSTSSSPKRNKVAHLFDFSEVAGYFFRKKDPNRKSNFNLKMMHGINKISILMFLICVIVIVARTIIRSL